MAGIFRPGVHDSRINEVVPIDDVLMIPLATQTLGLSPEDVQIVARALTNHLAGRAVTAS